MPDESKYLRVRTIDGITVIRFNDLSRCTHEGNAAHQLGQELLAVAHAEGPLTIILDFRNENFLPAAIFESELIRFYRVLGGHLRMCNVPSLVQEHFQMNRLATIFHIHSSLEDAMQAVVSKGD